MPTTRTPHSVLITRETTPAKPSGNDVEWLVVIAGGIGISFSSFDSSREVCRDYTTIIVIITALSFAAPLNLLFVRSTYCFRRPSLTEFSPLFFHRRHWDAALDDRRIQILIQSSSETFEFPNFSDFFRSEFVDGSVRNTND